METAMIVDARFDVGLDVKLREWAIFNAARVVGNLSNVQLHSLLGSALQAAFAEMHDLPFETDLQAVRKELQDCAGALTKTDFEELVVEIVEHIVQPGQIRAEKCLSCLPKLLRPRSWPRLAAR